MVISETPRIIIKMMYTKMIIPFIMLESTLIAVITVAALGIFRAAAIPLSFWCKRGFRSMIGKYNCIYKEHARGITV